jgi:hypothetical protein
MSGWWNGKDERMRARIVVGLLLLFGVVLGVAPAQAEGWSFELFAGYYFPEELDEDLTYGLRFGREFGGDSDWGWEVSGQWFDVDDSQGLQSLPINLDLFHVDFSFDWHMGGGPFHVFFGPGFATVELDGDDGFGGHQEFSDDVFSVHAGLGWDIAVGESVFIPLEARARWYELDDTGLPGGQGSQVDYEASAGIGFRF